MIVVFVPPLVTRAADVARAVAAATAGWSVPVVTTFPGAEGSPVADEVWRGSLPSYPSPERAVLALARTVRYAEWRARPAGAVPDLSDVDSESAERVVRRVLLQARGGRDLTGQEATELLAAYGIDLLTERTAASRDDAVAAAAVVGYPVVLKAGERQLRHRADLSGVRLDLPDATAVAAAYDSMPGDGTVVVQPMAPVGVATTLAVQDDPSFGALVTFGVAGVASELLGDVAYRPRRCRMPMPLIWCARYGPGRSWRGTAARHRSTWRRWRISCCGSGGWPRTCLRCCGSTSSRSSSASAGLQSPGLT